MKITDKIEITNEDNMTLMSRYEDNYFDLAIIDPPYGGNDAINLKDNKKEGKQATKRKKYHSFENEFPKETFFKELFRVSKNQIIWGVNFYPYNFLTGGRLVWDKKGTAFGRAELAFLSLTKSVDIVEIQWNGMLQSDMKNKEIRIHPTQKPVALYKYLINKYLIEKNGGGRILDTHIGSGSIAIACHDYGVELTGCEIDEKYYQDTIKRIQNHVSQLKLF